MPFAYEIEHLYVDEFRIGEFAIRRIREKMKICLPKAEITDVWVCLC